jgi:hypothetical protein
MLVRLGAGTGRYFPQRQQRFSTTSASTKLPPSKAKKWARRVALLGGLWVSAFLFDTFLNDDADVVLQDFFVPTKSRLTPEERAKLPKVAILGSGWGALSMIRKLHVDEFNVTGSVVFWDKKGNKKTDFFPKKKKWSAQEITFCLLLS